MSSLSNINTSPILEYKVMLICDFSVLLFVLYLQRFSLSLIFEHKGFEVLLFVLYPLCVMLICDVKGLLFALYPQVLQDFFSPFIPHRVKHNVV